MASMKKNDKRNRIKRDGHWIRSLRLSLAAYLERQDVSLNAFARDIGVNYQTILAWYSDKSRSTRLRMAETVGRRVGLRINGDQSASWDDILRSAVKRRILRDGMTVKDFGLFLGLEPEKIRQWLNYPSRTISLRFVEKIAPAVGVKLLRRANGRLSGSGAGGRSAKYI